MIYKLWSTKLYTAFREENSKNVKVVLNRNKNQLTISYDPCFVWMHWFTADFNDWL